MASKDGGAPVRGVHVPVTIDGRPAVHVHHDEHLDVFAPARDGGGVSPFPHVSMRDGSVHISDMVQNAKAPTRPGATHTMKNEFQAIAGPPSRPGLQQLKVEESGWGRQVKGDGGFVGEPLSPRTTANAAPRFDVHFEAVETRAASAAAAAAPADDGKSGAK